MQSAEASELAEIDFVESLPRTRSTTRWERLWRPFWVLPLAIVVVATAAGLAVPALDRLLDTRVHYFFSGSPEAARSILSTIAGAMISVTGLVFSITMVVVQLAASQFTPRVLGDFLANRITQVTLGIFTASFTYALTVLRSVKGQAGGDGAFVPQISVTLAFLLVLASVGMFLAFINHTTTSIQVGSTVSRLGETTLEVVSRYYPESDTSAAARGDEPQWHSGERHAQELGALEHGHIVEVDLHRLVDWAEEHDCVVELLAPVGEFVAEGMPALRIWGTGPVSEEDCTAVRRAVIVEQDRFHQQDPAYGIRKLVDIAERALSPGINDPTTAVEVLNELHRVCRTLVQRKDLPRVVSRNGAVRLLHRPQEILDLLDLAFEEVLAYGAESFQVLRRVLVILADLRSVTRSDFDARLVEWEEVARRHLVRREHDHGRAGRRDPAEEASA